MKLTELHPRWARDASADGGRFGLGLTFDCPCCRKERLHVFFRNPVDGGSPVEFAKNLWERSGTTFEDLSLHPSIDSSSNGHWHGYIVNGEIR